MVDGESPNDQVFVRDGFKHYRRRYNVREVKAGAVILVGLTAVVVWVGYRGAHPDEALFAEPPGQVYRGPSLNRDATSSSTRGPVPSNIAPENFREGAISHFDGDNVYVKINGREGFYKSFGFEALSYVTLVGENTNATIDIELFDLGVPSNALACFAAEAPDDATYDTIDGGFARTDRNAVYLTRGKFYLRAIGSDESPLMKAALSTLVKTFERAIPGAELPWSYSLFVSMLAHKPSAVSIIPENAFSFGFARNVHTVAIDDDTTLFVVPCSSSDEARILAKTFVDGFADLGARVKPHIVEDRYLQRMSGTTACETFVCGVKDASDVKRAQALLDDLTRAVGALSPEVKARASERAKPNVEPHAVNVEAEDYAEQ